MITYFLIALCVAMLFTAPAYAEETSGDGIVINGETGYEPPADGVDYITREDAAAMIEDAVPEITVAPEPTEYPGITPDQLSSVLESTLSNSVKVELSPEQLAALAATPETAAPALTIWDKPFNEYSPQEGYTLMIFVVVLAAFVFMIFRRF